MGVDLDLRGNVQFWGVQLQQEVQPTEDQDSNDDGKVTDEGTELEHIEGGEKVGEETDVQPREAGSFRLSTSGSH